MAKQPDPKAQAREKEGQIDGFLEDLRRYARAFTWRLDSRIGLRGEHPEYRKLFCPIAAVWFATTGDVLDNGRVFEVADKEMNLRFASLDIAVAADERHESPLFKRLASAVGLKGQAA